MSKTSSIKPIRFGEVFLCLTLLATMPALAGARPAPTPANTGANAMSMEKEGTKRFYQESKRGWFWYEQHLVEGEEEPKQIRPEPITPEILGSDVSEAEEKNERTTREVPVEELWNMHPDDFQHLLNRQQKKAVQYPSEHNVAMYLRTQDVARRKALAYTNTAQLVTQKNAAAIGLSDVYPTSTPGALARVQMQQGEIGQTIADARNNHALLNFTKQGCGFCDQQAQILAYFSEKYGWEVKFIDIGQQPDLATRFNITTTPTLLLIKQGEEQYMPIAVGVIALSEMEKKLYQAVRFLRGDTSPESFTTHDFERGSGLDPTSILQQQ